MGRADQVSDSARPGHDERAFESLAFWARRKSWYRHATLVPMSIISQSGWAPDICACKRRPETARSKSKRRGFSSSFETDSTAGSRPRRTDGRIRPALHAASFSRMARWVRRARSAAKAHPSLADGFLSVLLLLAALLSIRVQVDAKRASDPTYRLPDMWLILLVTVTATLVLTARRRFPLTVLGVTTAALIAARLLDSPEDDVGFAAVLAAAYSAGAFGLLRRRSWVFAAAFLALAVELTRPFLPALGEHGAWLGLAFDLLFNLAILSVFWAFGVTMRVRRKNEKELARRAAELERQREQNARRAVFDERVRIARELHDVVAHHVVVMGIQAGAARRAMTRKPERVEESLAAIEEASRQAVGDLHKMLGFLRQDGDPDDPSPQPTLTELDQLVAHVAKAKLRVEVLVEGEPESLPRTIEVSAYRVVQEALTNILKHAGASQATVRLRYQPETLDVTIIDDGSGGSSEPGRRESFSPGGHGLIGMRERVGVHGGRLRAGPLPEGGFEVHATFPRRSTEQ